MGQKNWGFFFFFLAFFEKKIFGFSLFCLGSFTADDIVPRVNFFGKKQKKNPWFTFTTQIPIGFFFGWKTQKKKPPPHPKYFTGWKNLRI